MLSTKDLENVREAKKGDIFKRTLVERVEEGKRLVLHETSDGRIVKLPEYKCRFKPSIFVFEGGKYIGFRHE